MVLTLEITGAQAALGAERRKVFRAVGGTIGRQANNDLVLPDFYVSARHARIRYADGLFYLEDNGSSNGVCVNRVDRRLQTGESYVLKHGDLILIEPFEIRASISAEPAEAPNVDPFRVVQDARPLESALPDGDVSAEPFDLDDMFGAGGRSKQKPVVKPAGAPAGVWRDAFKPPAPVPEPPPIKKDVIPTNWDIGARPEPPTPAPPPPVLPASQSAWPSEPSSGPSPGATDVGLRAVLEAAGIDVTGMSVTPELAQHFGQILRVVVEGVMELLQARQGIKDEFGLRSTSFRKADNNPLKFSANLEDALHNLLVKRNAAYLGPVEAFDDAFQDLRFHQMAVLHGMREAFQAMLAQFDPALLQEEFDRQGKKGSLLSVPAKLRYWDQYREKLHDMVSDADESFRELFGDAFAKAYEKQLARLRSQGRTGKV